MLTQTVLLKNHRQEIYSLFHKRKDSIMNLLDAISSFGHRSRSVVQLSEAPCFERQYSSITDAIADGLPYADWESIEGKQFHTLHREGEEKSPCFLLDCTPNPRPFARKLADRSITHAPNPAPGNKPICVGHQYACVAMLPNDESARNKKWVLPISMQRVKSSEKGNELGLLQIAKHIQQFNLEDEGVISVGDSLYGSEACRVQAGKLTNLVHIFRLNGKRNLYKPFQYDELSTRGRKKVYGDKVSLFDDKTLPPPDRQAETGRLCRSGRVAQIKIDAWDDMLIRGSKHYDARKHKVILLRVKTFDDRGNELFKRPLWLAAQGQARKSISLVSLYNYYADRYNIEHFFRFNKNNLLLDEFQTYDVEHEENWWKLCMLAYNQLYLARSLVSLQVKPWEKYLPKDPYNLHRKNIMTTPSQAQRGFESLLAEIGTPAVSCIPRGRCSGRKKGEKLPALSEQPIIFKTKKPDQKEIILGLDNLDGSSTSQKIQSLIRSVRTRLVNLNFAVNKFSEMLCDTG